MGPAIIPLLCPNNFIVFVAGCSQIFCFAAGIPLSDEGMVSLYTSGPFSGAGHFFYIAAGKQFRLSAVCCRVTVDFRRDAHRPLEHPDKVIQVGDAALQGDGLDGEVGIRKQVPCVGNSLLVHIVSEGHPDFFPE